MVAQRLPSYDLRSCSLSVVAELCALHHGYGGAGSAAVYAFAVFEEGRAVAAYAWQPPPYGAARAVCPEAPWGVLALSRMVAVPREERRLRHVSTPLRRQMRKLIDRGRWPALVTYSDMGQGHTGHVYRCSGWQPTTTNRRPTFENAAGERRSTYRRGKHDRTGLVQTGTTTLQRWEHHACPPGQVVAWMADHGWRREPDPGRVWRSGRQAHRIVRAEPGEQISLAI